MSENVKNDYLPGIDGLRAIAVLAVVLFHMGLFSFFKGGFIGVDIFFVISGYVISKSLYGKASLGPLRYLSEFYKRRIRRIVPALVVCLSVTTIASILFIPSSWLSNTIDSTGLSAFFGASNFALIFQNDGYFSPKVDFNPFLHTWSLAVEEQFYLLFPMIYFVWLKFGKNKTMVGALAKALLAILGIASLVFALFETNVFHDRAFYLLPARFWELASGALLFQSHSKGKLLCRSKNLSRVLMLSAFLLIGIGFVFANEGDFPFPWALVPVAVTLLLISGVAGARDSATIARKFLASSVMTYIGKISYSLYLWHWPVAVLLKWTVGFETPWQMLLYLAVSFSLASLSYRFIETPVRKSKFLSRQKNWKVVLVGAAVLPASFFLAQFAIDSKTDLSLSVTKDSYIWRSGKYWRDEQHQPVSFDPNIAGRKIFALGDSHTAHYRTMLHIVSGQLGFEAREYEQGDCAVAGLLKPMAKNEAFNEYYENSLKDIKKKAKPGDIVFLASLRMPELSDNFEIVDIAFVQARFNSVEAIKNRELALGEADRIIDEFEALGLHVIISAPEPILKVPLFRCSDWFNKMNPIASPGTTISRGFLIKLRQPVMESLRSLQEKHPDLFVWDPLLVLCDKEEFSAYDGKGLPLFFDGDHFSANANRHLAPSFKEAVLAIWARP